MILDGFSYINLPVKTNDLLKDIENLYTVNCRRKNFLHVLAVANSIEELSVRFHLEKDICILASYCHDIAVIIHPQDMLEYARQLGMQIFTAEEKYPFLLHQRFSVMIAEEYFDIRDQRLLSSVGVHSTLKTNPSDYEMALFLADKLSWDQDGIPPYFRTVHDALDQSLYHAALAYIDYVMQHDMILYPHLWLEEAYKWLQEYCHGLEN